ncbi:MAG: tetratricopeptide repeat protein, partial [Acidobacteriota bacterium]|nr:tetratricopeptide repeat protein [Acidobacteriota bacterium]
AEVALDLGRALEATGKSAEAEAAYRRALALEPNLSVTHYTLGTLLARTGRREEAEQHIELYREYFQKEQERRFRAGSRQAELNLGWMELSAGRAEAALAQFSRHPDDVEALRGAAAALARIGRHEEAVRTLERALLLDPGNRALRYELDREREKTKAP